MNTQPTTTRKTMRRHNIALFGTGEKSPKPMVEPVRKDRRVIFTKAGAFAKARYEGRTAFVFGVDKSDARSRLKVWDTKEAA